MVPANEIFIEYRGGKYVALQNGHVIAMALTQEQAGERARELKPKATILAQRVCDVSTDERDKWRVIHQPAESGVFNSHHESQ